MMMMMTMMNSLPSMWLALVKLPSANSEIEERRERPNKQAYANWCVPSSKSGRPLQQNTRLYYFPASK